MSDIDLVKVFRNLAGTPGSGVAVCAYYPNEGFASDNSLRTRMGSQAIQQGARFIAFDNNDDTVFVAAKFEDQETADLFARHIKGNPNVCVLENF